jgi:predicted enzyme related to lactoylglutathione lyase
MAGTRWDGRRAASATAGHVHRDSPYWDVYFAVDDIAAASQTAAGHGGTRLMPPTPIEIGTIAVFLDPAGAIFTLVQLSAEEAAE